MKPLVKKRRTVLASKREVYNWLWGDMAISAEKGGFNTGLSIDTTRRRLSPHNGRPVNWAVMVCKLYLKGERHGFTPQYPTEELYNLSRYSLHRQGGRSDRKPAKYPKTSRVPK